MNSNKNNNVIDNKNFMDFYVINNKSKKFEGKVFDVYEYDIHIEKETIKRDIIERKDGVVIVPIDEDGKLIMLSEYCAGSNSYILSFPGGSVESNDSVEENAQRELIEETGYKSKNMSLLMKTYEHPSTTNRKIYVFLAKDLEKSFLENEDKYIKIERLYIDEALEKCSNNFNSDITSIAILNILNNKKIENKQI